MATAKIQSLLLSSSSSSNSSSSSRFRACLQAPTNPGSRSISLPKLPPPIDKEEMRPKEENTAINNTKRRPVKSTREENYNHVSQLYAIMEAVADRAEMHAIIGEQRNNWNHLFLHSINSITLTASIMAGISSIPVLAPAAPHLLAFKLSSALLFTAATGMMLAVNRIQPSQLAEEQRNATRLFRQLENSIRTTLALRTPTKLDVEEAMARVLALDKAYPLPLLPGMLDKFPKTVKPAVWWPELDHSQVQHTRAEGEGWSRDLEEEMKGILGVLKRRDEEEYMRWDKLVLKINRILAVSGPLLAGLAAVGAGLIGIPALGPWPALAGVVGGALAATMNTLEHGGQVGMVFELFRNCAGFYLQLEEAIESNLGEEKVENRENGEMLELKMALQLGRSVSELKTFASYASSSSKDGEATEFAGKLF